MRGRHSGGGLGPVAAAAVAVASVALAGRQAPIFGPSGGPW